MYRTLLGLGLLAALAVGLVRISPAQAKPEDSLTAYVPKDAAFFAQVRLADVWQSQVGASIREAKIKDVDKVLGIFERLTGMTADDIIAANIWFPGEIGGDFTQKFGASLQLKKPLDEGRLMTALALGEIAMEGKMVVKRVDGRLFIDLPPNLIGRRNNDKEKQPQAVVDLRNPKLVHVFFNLDEKYLKPSRDDSFAIAPALKAADEGKAFAIGFNFDSLPPELKMIEELPPEARPFGPLIKCDAMFASGVLSGKELAVDVRFRSKDKIVLRDAERSMGAGVNLLSGLMDSGIKELTNTEAEKQKPAISLLQALKAMLQTSKIRVEEPDAVATGTLPLTLPFGAALAAQFDADNSTPGGRAARAQSQNNLKQLALAMHNYHDSIGTFPPAAICSKKGKPMLSWRVAILPYIEQDNLYRQFKLDEPWDSEHNLKLADVVIKTYCLPGSDDAEKKTTHYQLCVGNGAGFDKIQPTRITGYTDGTSNTLMIATAAKPVPWTKPDDIDFDPKAKDIKSLFYFKDAGEVCNIAMADGSVRALKKTTSEETLKAIITRGGGEVINLNE